MIRTKLAKKVLTKKEQKHLTEMNINSIASMQRQIDFMGKMNDDDFPCYECRHIANKLGIKKSGIEVKPKTHL